MCMCATFTFIFFMARGKANFLISDVVTFAALPKSARWHQLSNRARFLHPPPLRIDRGQGKKFRGPANPGQRFQRRECLHTFIGHSGNPEFDLAPNTIAFLQIPSPLSPPWERSESEMNLPPFVLLIQSGKKPHLFLVLV